MFGPLVEVYRGKVARRGVPADSCERVVRTRPATAAALLLETGQVDAAMVGGLGEWMRQWHQAYDVIGKDEHVGRVYAMTGVILPAGTLFFVDTHLLVEPTAEQVAEMTVLAAEQVRAFGMTPKAALLSHSNFGASQAPGARKMREALRLIRLCAPDLEVDGEMHADAALVQAVREKAVTDSPLTEGANLLVFPNLDAANIAYNLVKATGDGLQIGPMLLGMNKPIHVLVPSVTARGIANLTALAVTQVRG